MVKSGLCEPEEGAFSAANTKLISGKSVPEVRFSKSESCGGVTSSSAEFDGASLLAFRISSQFIKRNFSVQLRLIKRVDSVISSREIEET